MENEADHMVVHLTIDDGSVSRTNLEEFARTITKCVEKAICSEARAHLSHANAETLISALRGHADIQVSVTGLTLSVSRSGGFLQTGPTTEYAA